MIFKKRKYVALIVALVLMVSTAPTALADASGICYPAIDDDIIDISYAPVFLSGTAYVPMKLFTANWLLRSDYFDPSSTALLYSDSKQIFFEMETGKSYDSYLNVYPVSAVFYGSQVYVPIAWVCGYFGYGYSYTSGNGNGDIARIKTGAQELSDSGFMDAATVQYFPKPEQPSPSPTPPSPTPTEIKEQESFARVSLCFTGLPTKALLDTFDNFKYKASFFLTADEINSDPDIVRRICGSGHSIGIYVTTNPETEVPHGADALFTAAQIRPTLLYSQAAVADTSASYAKTNGMAYFTPSFTAPAGIGTSGIAKQIDLARDHLSISMIQDKAMDTQIYSILSYIFSNKITVTPLRETLA